MSCSDTMLFTGGSKFRIILLSSTHEKNSVRKRKVVSGWAYLFLFLFCSRTFVSLASNNSNTPDTSTLLNLYHFQSLLVSLLIFSFFKKDIFSSLILVSLDIMYLGCALFGQAVTAVCYQ